LNLRCILYIFTYNPGTQTASTQLYHAAISIFLYIVLVCYHALLRKV